MDHHWTWFLTSSPPKCIFHGYILPYLRTLHHPNCSKCRLWHRAAWWRGKKRLRDREWEEDVNSLIRASPDGLGTLSDEGAHGCHTETIKILESSQWWEEIHEGMMKANITSITFIKVDLVANISCCEGDRANSLGNNFQKYEGQEDHWEWYEAD